MEYGFLSRAGKFLQEQRKHRRWMMMFLCLAGGVTLGTLAFLKLYGQAMTHQVKMLDCQYEVHVHTEDCYEENEDGEEVLICEYADYAEYVIHVHNDDCYDQKGNLVCPLEEHELHEHDDDCWEEEDVLICGEEEAEGSTERSESGTKAAETVAVSEGSQDAEEGSGSDAEAGKELACEKEEHKHDDSCYDGGSGCDLEEHSHDDGCYEKTETLVCEESEHTHDDGCYSEVKGGLACGESEHEHDDGCYDEDGEFNCDKDEHSHDDGCYEVTKELTCGEDEHTHGGGCYEVTEKLTCEIKEHEHDDSCEADSELICKIEEHEHDDSCYIETKAETEKKESSRSAKEDVQEEVKETSNSKEEEEGHIHTDDCYETEEVMTCGELELHIHDDSCYDEDCFDEDGNLIEGSRVSCGLLQLEEHVHTEECFKIVELTPEEITALNGGATLHMHSEDCYDEDGNLICGHEVTHLHQLECYDEDGNLICGFGVKEETHEHDANCYDEEGNLICGHEDAKDHEHMKDCYDEEGNLICGYEGVKDHEHDANCYDEEGNLICGYEDAKNHEHDANCYDEEGNLICGYEGSKVHEHDANCYDMYGELICGYEGAQDHVHTEACYDEEGNLICGYVLREEYSNSKIFEGENYIVIAKYNEDANIPEEAQFLAEEITSDSDKEHYERRESEYREMVDDDMASMRALLKIGFYVEGEDEELTEIEPETSVMISVQFLDEDGLPEGRPVTVIHFAEEGTQMLDGGSAVDNSTTFTMESFSEIAIGYVPEEELRELKQGVDGTMRLQLDDTFEYVDDAFQITFHVKGEAILPADTIYRPAEAEDAEQSDENVAAAAENGSKETKETPEGESAEAAESEEAEKIEEAAEAETSESMEEEAEAEESEKTEDAAEAETSESTEDGTKAESEETTETSSEEAAETTEEKQEGESGETMEVASTETPETTEEGAEGESGKTTEAVLTDKTGNPKLRFRVEQLDKASEEYQAFKAHAEKAESENDLYRLEVMTYKVTYGDEELDLSRCEVTATFRPSPALMNKAQISVEEAVGFLTENDSVDTVSEIVSTSDVTPYLLKDGETGDGAEGSDADTALTDGKGDDADVTPADGDGDDMDATPADGKGDDTDVTLAKPEAGKNLENGGAEAGTPENPDGDGGSKPEIYTLNNLDTDGAGEDEKPQTTGDLETGDGTDVIITFTEVSVDNILFDVYSLNASEPKAVTVVLNKSTFGARVAAQPNPKFTVQYYANLDVMATTGVNAIKLIDTSKNGDGTGGVLPVNGNGANVSPNGNDFKYMYVDVNGKVETENTLTEVYNLRKFEYHKAPTINYMNALVENTNYKLKEVWVLKPGNEETSTEKADWDIYPYNENLHFTNRRASADGKTYIHIEDGAVIRFVYDTTSKDKEFSANFYDYDISNGYIYRAQPPQDASSYRHLTAGDVFDGDDYNKNYVVDQFGLGGKGFLAWGTANDYHWDSHIYTYTRYQGINSSVNYSGSGTKLGFGNVNTGTGLGDLNWKNAEKDNKLNRYNGVSYQGCTFGLVTGMSGDMIQYASGVQAPNLFNDGTATGKTSYSNYPLEFTRNGDTYTLSEVKGTVATRLGSFSNPENSQGNYDGNHGKSVIWTNNFWPMDSAPSFGTGTHDVKFGATANYKGGAHELRFGPQEESIKKGDITFPESDDGLYHNSYFGMNYEVEFDLTKDYAGPLEYYFFGDDDMWVFLDGKLVCDIGGVHSSVGEYVNLWDYLHKHTSECYDFVLTCTEDHEHTDDCLRGFKLTCTKGITHDHSDEENCYAIEDGKKVLTCKKNTKKLSFFYTERGASGSTCWMQFTLPSVSSLTPETTEKDYGELRVEKTVTQVSNGQETIVDNNDEFSFTINFTDKDGNKLPDDYSYVKYDKDGKEIGHNLIIWDGGDFTLKNGQYIVVKHLPEGTQYTITEANQALTVTDSISENSKIKYFTDITVDGTLADNKKDLDNEKVAEGDIPKAGTAKVEYNNKFDVFELPETGGLGLEVYTMAGALVIMLGAGFLYKKKLRERRV